MKSLKMVIQPPSQLPKQGQPGAVKNHTGDKRLRRRVSAFSLSGPSWRLMDGKTGQGRTFCWFRAVGGGKVGDLDKVLLPAHHPI